MNHEPFGAGARDGVSNGIELHIDAERAKPGTCEQPRVPPSAHREIQGSAIRLPCPER
jgi:hypothetical protein